MVYFIVLALILFCIYAYDYKRKSVGDLVMYVGICVFMICIAGLRYRIGGDSVGYENEFQNIPTLSSIGTFKFNTIRWEPGFIYFMSLSKSIIPDFTFFQFLHATIINSIIFWFIYKNTSNKYLAVCFYFVCLFLDFNTEVLRESIAVCIFLLAWPFFKRGNWIIYYLLVFCATFFHLSSLLTFLFPIFAIPGIRQMFRLGYRTIFICLILFGISLVLGKTFFTLIQAMSVNETVTERAMMYASSRSYGAMVLNVFGMMDSVVKNIFIPICAVWYLRKTLTKDEDSKEVKDFLKMEIIVMTGVYISVLGLVIFILQRFTNYTNIFAYVFMASCFFKTAQLKRKKKFKLAGSYWFCIFIIVMALNFKGYFANTYGSQTYRRYMLYYPYYSRLDHTEDPNREQILRFGSHIK